MKVYEETKKAFRDACIFGDGFVKHWHDSNGNIHMKRVFKPCLIVNQAEVMYGQEPKTIYEVRIVDKMTLKQKYPDFAHEIDEASISDIPFFIDSFEIIEFGVEDIVRSGLCKEYLIAKHELGLTTR